jgi:hypothetical protein
MMQDLSPLAKDSMWASSQAGGNMTSTNRQAMTAPGSPPVDPLIDRASQGDPTVQLGEQMKTGTSGKPQASGQASFTPTPVRWGPTTVPKVVRGKTVNAPGAEVPR